MFVAPNYVTWTFTARGSEEDTEGGAIEKKCAQRVRAPKEFLPRRARGGRERTALGAEAVPRAGALCLRGVGL